MVATVTDLNDNQIRSLTDKDWAVLIQKIKNGKCTPFIGSGIYHDLYTIRSTIAKSWAQTYDYPLSDSDDLASVARFLAVEFDPEYVHSMFIEELKKFPTPRFDDPNDPHGVLATLPLPIYVTTNYDDFMSQALLEKRRDVKTEVCKWKKSLDDEVSYLEGDTEPSIANPSVFHLYGHAQNSDSLVLTEDDYFQFLINVSIQLNTRIPHRIQRAMSSTALMLLGYRMNDWDFRSLFHLLASSVKMSPDTTHVAVQISPVSDSDDADLSRKIENYFDKYFKTRRLNICISWETTQDFVSKLKERWEASGYANS